MILVYNTKNKVAAVTTATSIFHYYIIYHIFEYKIKIISSSETTASTNEQSECTCR